MALYEYSCKSCGASEVVVRGITDQESKPTCKSCETDMTRVYSSGNVGIIFNGSGFYSKEK